MDTSRQLDQFANLHLGLSDDEEDGDDDRRVAHEGVGGFANLLSADDAQGPPPSVTPSPASTAAPLPESADGDRKSKGKNKRRKKGKRKPSKWADKCMYAELLELHDSPLWTTGYGAQGVEESEDGLPSDLESGWVALAPVPVGKRCLAVSMQSAGLSGIAPNTMLRSRLLGKVLLPPFPSPLPSNTILDCILDERWKSTGILHVVDVIRWKGQDLAGCEAGFRFWWRDTRLSELPPWPLPRHARPSPYRQQEDIFPFPASFIAVPYFSPTPLEVLHSTIVPSAHAGRVIQVKVPNPEYKLRSVIESDEMEVDANVVASISSLPGIPAELQADIHLRSDGILLYVAEAAYESGTSPLSAWIPSSVQANAGAPHDRNVVAGASENEAPLIVFSRLLQKRLQAFAPTSGPMEA